MGFVISLQQDMYFIVLPDRMRIPQPFAPQNQLPLFYDKATLEGYPKKLKDMPPGYIFSQTTTWEELLQLLLHAKKLGADGVVFVPKDKHPKATPIELVIDEVTDMIA